MQRLVVLIALAVWVAFPGQNGHAQEDAADATPSYRYWKTNWSFQDVEIQNVLEKLNRIGIELPVSLSGRTSVDLDVYVPLNALGTGRAYRIDGAINVRNFEVDGFRYDLVRAQAQLRDGNLRLDELTVIETVKSDNQFDPNGTIIKGTASAQVLPQENFQANVKVTNLKVGLIQDLLKRLSLVESSTEIQGKVSGDVLASGKVSDLQAADRWTLSGNLAIDSLQRVDALPLDIRLNNFLYKETEITVPELSVTSPEREDFFLNANANLRFDTTTEFSADIATNDFRFSEIAPLISFPTQWVSGKFDLKGSVAGVIKPAGEIDTIDIQVAIASPDLEISGVRLGLLEHDLALTNSTVSLKPRDASSNGTQGDVASNTPILNELSATYELNQERLQLSDLNAQIFGGTIQGSASIARVENFAHKLDLTWEGISPVIDLPIQRKNDPPTLTLSSSGKIDWAILSPAGTAGSSLGPSAHRGTLTANLDALAIDSQRIGNAELNVRIGDDNLQLAAHGNVFGGTFNVDTTANFDETVQWNQLPHRIEFNQFQFTDLSLGDFLTALTTQRSPIAGRLSGNLSPQRDESNWNAVARMQVSGLSVNNEMIARRIAATAKWDGTNIVITGARGRIAQGRVEADGNWSLGTGPKVCSVRVTRVNGDHLLLPFFHDADEWIGGRISARAVIVGTGNGLGESVRLSGSIATENGIVFGIPIGDGRSPIDLRMAFSPFQWDLRLPLIHTEIARGHLRGDVRMRSAAASRAGIHFDSHWRIQNIDFEAMLKETIGSDTIGKGNLTGDMTLVGRNIRGARDLGGRFNVKLGGTDAMAVPGLSTANSFLGATSLVGVRFENGEAIGRLSKGRMLMEKVILTSDRVSVLAQGSVGILDQRMDINTVISTGNFQGQNVLLRQIGSQALVDVMPLSRVNRLISDRTIVLEMAGPVRDPIIRLMAGETLQANARRFVSQELVGLLIADSLLFD